MATLLERDKYKILLIEDNLIDRKLIHEFVEQTKLSEFELKDTDRLSSALQLLADESFDAVLLDLFLPDAGKLEALDKIIDYKADLPIVILTGLGDEELGISAVRRGAQDYLVKGDFERSLLIRSITYAIERKKAEIALLESEKKYRMLFESSGEGRIISDPSGMILDVNPAAAAMLGYENTEELKKIRSTDLYAYPEQRKDLFEKLVKRGFIDEMELIGKKKDGKFIHILSTFIAHKDEEGELLTVDGVFRDITRIKLAEEALQQKTLDLEERVKEINCLYGVSQLTRDPQRPIDEVLQQVTSLAPQGWQYPDITCARIILEEKTYMTDNFQETRWKQMAGVIVSDKKIGAIEVYYLKDMPAIFEGPFLKEERDLIDALAREIGYFIERNQKNNELRESEARYRQLVDNLGEIIFTLTPEGIISSLNPAFEKITGWSREEFINTPFIRLVHPDDLLVLIEKFEAYPLALQPETFEVRIKTKSGQTLVVEGTVTPQFENEKIIGFFGVTHDITDRKQVEETLRESEERLKSFMDSATVSFSLWDSDLNLVDNNEASMKMFHPPGTKKEDVIGKSMFELSPDLKKTGRYKTYLEVIRTGTPYRIDDLFIHPKYGDIHLSLEVFKVGSGLGVIATDITKRKQAENEIKKTKARLEYLLISNPAVIYACEPREEYKITYMSPNVKEITGYQPQDFIGNPDFWIEGLHPEDRQRATNNYNQIAETGYYSGVYRFQHRDGTYQWMLEEAKLITDDQGTLLEIIGYWTDITERKQAEEALKQSEEKYRLLFESAPIGIGIADLEGNILEINQTMLEMTGYDSEEIKNVSLSDTYVNPEDRTKLIHTLQKSGQVQDLEVQLKRKDGTNYPSSLNVVLMELRGQQVLLTTLRDLTQWRELERAKSESEEQYKALFEYVPIGLYRSTPDRRFITANSTFLEMIGFTSFEELSLQNIEELDSNLGYSRELFIAAINKDGIAKGLEQQIKRPDGSSIFVRENARAVKDAAGSVIYYEGSFEDITIQIEFEKVLKESEEKYRTLFTFAPIGIGFTNFDGKFLAWNTKMLEITGYSENEIFNINVSEIFNNSDDHQLLLKSLSNNRRLRDWEVQLKRKEGNTYYAVLDIELIEFVEEETLHITVRDITERKQAEKALRASEKKYRDLISNLADTVLELDLEGNFTFVSPQGFNLLGYQPEEVIGKNGFEFIHPDDIENAMEALEKALSDTQVFDFEYRVRHKDGHYIDISSSGKIVDEEEESKLISVIRDITERKQVEKALRASEKKFRDLISNLSDGVVEMDLEGNFTFLSPQTFSLLGYQPEEVMGTNGFELIHPDDIENAMGALEAALSGTQVFDFEYRGYHKDGHYVDLCASGKIVGEDEASKLILVIRNITERKKTEDALRESEKKYRDLITNITDVVVEIDSGVNFTFVSPQVFDTLGYQPEELIGRSGLDLIHPDDLEDVLVHAEKIVSGERVPDFEYRIKHKIGYYVSLSATSKLVMVEEENKIVSVLRNISERIKAENEIKRAKELLEKTFESLDNAVFVLDSGNPPVILDCNPAACQIFGYKKQEMVNRPTSFLHVDKSALLEFQNIIYPHIEKEGSFSEFEFKMKRRNSEVFPSEHYVTQLFDDENNKIGWISVIRDITNRKEAEKELRLSDEILKQMPDGILLVDFDEDKVQRWMGQAEQIFGYTADEAIGKPVNFTYHPDVRGSVQLQIKKNIMEIGEFYGEILCQRKDGSEVPIEITAKTLYDKDGEPIAVIGINKDISERKEAETRLRESEERFRSLFESSPDGNVLTDLLGNIVTINKPGVIMIGYKDEYELIGISAFEIIAPEDQELALRNLKQTLESGEARNLEYTILKKDGTPLPVAVNIELIRNSTNDPKYFLATIRDITERKKSEVALQESEIKYRTILDSIEDSYYEVDIDGNFCFFNDQLCNLLGCSRQELLGTSYQQFGDKKAAENAYEAFNDVYRTGSPKSGYNWEIIRKDGAKRYVDVSISLITDSTGESTGFRGIARDISERKAAENALHRSEERLRSFMDSATESFYLLNQNLNVIDLNEHALNILNITKDKIIGKNMFDIDPSIKKTDRYNKYIEVIKTGEPLIEDIIASSPKFGQRNYSVRVFKAGDGLGIMSADITEIKQAEQALKESEERFRTIFNRAPIGMSISDLDYQFIKVNEIFCQILGYTMQEFTKRTFRDITHPDHIKRDVEYIKKLGKGEIDVYRTEKRYIKKNNEILWARTSVNLLLDDVDEPYGYLAMIEDITHQKRIEEETRKQLMRFKIDDGNIYLIKESLPALSIQVFSDLIKLGYPGLVVSRTPMKEFQKGIEGEFKFLWFSETGEKQSIPPDLREIELIIDTLAPKSVTWIDRLDYLVQKNGFKETLKSLFRLREIAYLKDLVVILSIDPSTIQERYIRSLEKEAKPVEPRFLVRVPDEMLEILRFIYQQNNLGMKPSYTDIGNELELSKPTARKRLKQLVATGYLNEQKSGNRKILELTEKGLMSFKK